jgi:hypothetical protein
MPDKAQLHLVAVESQQLREHRRTVRVVVDQQDAARVVFRLRDLHDSGVLFTHQGQPDLECRASAFACTVDRDAAAVHVDELFDDRQANAEAALRAIERSLALHEELEHLG